MAAAANDAPACIPLHEADDILSQAAPGEPAELMPDSSSTRIIAPVIRLNLVEAPVGPAKEPIGTADIELGIAHIDCNQHFSSVVNGILQAIEGSLSIDKYLGRTEAAKEGICITVETPQGPACFINADAGGFKEALRQHGPDAIVLVHIAATHNEEEAKAAAEEWFSTFNASPTAPIAPAIFAATADAEGRIEAEKLIMAVECETEGNPKLQSDAAEPSLRTALPERLAENLYEAAAYIATISKEGIHNIAACILDRVVGMPAEDICAWARSSHSKPRKHQWPNPSETGGPGIMVAFIDGDNANAATPLGFVPTKQGETLREIFGKGCFSNPLWTVDFEQDIIIANDAAHPDAAPTQTVQWDTQIQDVNIHNATWPWFVCTLMDTTDTPHHTRATPIVKGIETLTFEHCYEAQRAASPTFELSQTGLADIKDIKRMLTAMYNTGRQPLQ